MSIHTFTWLLLLIFPIGLFGQTPPKQFGVRVGANISDLVNGGSVSGSDHNFHGFHAGISGRFAVGKKGAILADILYRQKGTRRVMDFPGNDLIHFPPFQYRMREVFEYIELPLRYQYNTRLQGLSFHGGLSFEALIEARFRSKMVSSEGDVGGNEDNYLATDQFRRMGIGGILGVGYTLSDRLSILAEFNRSLTQIARPSYMFIGEKGEVDFGLKMYHQSFSISLAMYLL